MTVHPPKKRKEEKKKKEKISEIMSTFVRRSRNENTKTKKKEKKKKNSREEKQRTLLFFLAGSTMCRNSTKFSQKVMDHSLINSLDFSCLPFISLLHTACFVWLRTACGITPQYLLRAACFEGFTTFFHLGCLLTFLLSRH